MKLTSLPNLQIKKTDRWKKRNKLNQIEEIKKRKESVIFLAIFLDLMFSFIVNDTGINLN